MIKEYLENKYGEEYLKRKGLKVITTLDWEMQEEAEKILEQNIETLKGYNAHNGSVVGMDPKTGEILTLVGSKNYFGNSYPDECIPGKDCMFDPEVNTAITFRQPGSSFKPFVYAKAFMDGYTPNTKLWDVLTEFSLVCNPNGSDERKICYHPRNYSGNYRGLISLKSSLAQSRNITSVKVLYLVGLKNFLEFVKSFGITSLSSKIDYGLSLVLGGGEVNLIEMVEGYSVFANDGVKSSPHFIKKIEGADGRIIEKANNKTIRVIPSYVAREINDILSDNEARSPVFGPNSMLNIKEFDAAAKTGTTQNYKDGWLIGYTPSIIFGVWVGNNDNTPMIKAPAVLLAGPIWNSLIRRFNRGGEFIPPQKRTTNNAALDGNIGSHSILYYINPNDPQLNHWEYNIRN